MKRISLLNIFVQNKDDVSCLFIFYFFQSELCTPKLFCHCDNSFIFGGYLNCALEPSQDKKGARNDSCIKRRTVINDVRHMTLYICDI